MRKLLIIVLSLVLCGSNAVLAEEGYSLIDPLKRNLIFVEGKSSIVVPVDGFKVRFGFDVEKSAFSEASERSNQIVAEIEKNVKGLGLSNIEIIKGWDLLKQAKISFGSKGKEISNKLTVTVKNYPKGQLHEMMAKTIDAGLVVDGSIVVEDIGVFISEKVENTEKEKVVEEALKALESNAMRTANALGRKVLARKRIYVTSEKIADESIAFEKGFYRNSYAKVAIRKSFKVNAEVVDHIRISATVTGIYEID